MPKHKKSYKELYVSKENKKIGRPKGEDKKQLSFKLRLHTVETLKGIQEDTGRTQSSIIDLAVDMYAGSLIKG
jgi:hypothetical protein